MMLAISLAGLAIALGAFVYVLHFRRRVERELAEWIDLAGALRRDVELEQIRADSAIGSLNEARRALYAVLVTPNGDERALAEAGLVASMLPGVPALALEELERG